ncbi:MAG: hypothetical protein AAGG07_06300 [Planctomycetota bacterium]
MSPIPHMRITGLRVTSPDLPAAELVFGSHNSLVYGASDTGKSFAFQAIDFCLGARDKPKVGIPEAKGYTAAEIGITTSSGEQLLVERLFTGAKAFIYRAAFGAAERGDGQKVNVQMSPKSASISSVLLSKCGLHDKPIQKDLSGKTGLVSFRELARFVTVGEGAMLSEYALPHQTKGVEQTPWLSTFRLLLTGQASSGGGETRNRYERLTQAEGGLGQLRLFRDKALEKLESLGGQDAADPDRINRLKTSVFETSSRLEEVRSEFASARENALKVSQELDAVRRSLRQSKEEAYRLQLLKDSYLTDLERLNAIREAGQYLALLPSGPCPTCGRDGPISSEVDTDPNTVASTIAAATAEEVRIKGELSSLDQALDDLASLGEMLSAENSHLQRKLREASAALDVDTGLELRDLLDGLGELRQALTNAQLAAQAATIVDDLDRQIRLVEDDQTKTKRTKQVQLPIPAYESVALSDRMSEMLYTWGYGSRPKVSWSADDSDFLIDGQQRFSFGKGYRAFIYSAFVLCLREHCIDSGIPHPGFVVLDSPLVTLQEKIKTRPGRTDVIDSTMKDGFFSWLGESETEHQVIVFDNVRPSGVAGRNLSVETFAGDGESGRRGFFPELT